jgi:hypothetical protein
VAPCERTLPLSPWLASYFKCEIASPLSQVRPRNSSGRHSGEFRAHMLGARRCVSDRARQMRNTAVRVSGGLDVRRLRASSLTTSTNRTSTRVNRIGRVRRRGVQTHPVSHRCRFCAARPARIGGFERAVKARLLRPDPRFSAAAREKALGRGVQNGRSNPPNPVRFRHTWRATGQGFTVSGADPAAGGGACGTVGHVDKST